MATGIESFDRAPRSLVFSAEPQTPKKSPVALVVSRLSTAARRYWFLLLLGLLGTGAGTYFGSNALVKRTWESSTTILYTSLPISEGDRGLFTAPDLKTLSALVNSPGTIEAIREEFHLDVPSKISPWSGPTAPR